MEEGGGEETTCYVGRGSLLHSRASSGSWRVSGCMCGLSGLVELSCGHVYGVLLGRQMWNFDITFSLFYYVMCGVL